MDVFDCVVIGGGPGGATVATLVAKAGRSVLLLERGRFPRFHVGESLMPETYWTFERLGILPRLKESNFVKKFSVQFITPSGKESQPFYFDEMNPHECSQTWQVVRSDFDKMMLDNAVDHGVEVWQDANVNDVVLEPSETDSLPRATGIVVTRKGQPPKTINARVVVDATGTNALLSKKLGTRVRDPKLRKASIFAHYRGARRDAGKNEGATLVISTPNHDGWFWYIPLPDDIVSIGVVGEVDDLIDSTKTPEQMLDEQIRNCRGLDDRMTHATRVSPVHVLSDFSYRSTRCAGDGWVLVGDAFGFLDPVYSSGVFLALKSGEMAADCIVDALNRNDVSAASLSKWGQPLADGMQAMRKLVYAFYTKTFSFGSFMRQHPHYKKNLVDLLIGDVFRPEVNAIFEDIKGMVELPEALTLDQPTARSAEPVPA